MTVRHPGENCQTDYVCKHFCNCSCARRDTTRFEINTGILKGNSVAYCLLITVLDYALRPAVDEEEGQTHSNPGVETTSIRLNKYLLELHFAAFRPIQLHNARSRTTTKSKVTELCLNVRQTKYVHAHQSSYKYSFLYLMKKTPEFKYLGSYINYQHIIQCSMPNVGTGVRALCTVWHSLRWQSTKHTWTERFTLLWILDIDWVTRENSRRRLHQIATSILQCVLVWSRLQAGVVRHAKTDVHCRNYATPTTPIELRNTPQPTTVPLRRLVSAQDCSKRVKLYSQANLGSRTPS